MNRLRAQAPVIWMYARWPLAIIGGLFGLILLWVVYLFATEDIPAALPDPASSSVVLAADGRELAVVRGDEYRRAVTLDDVSDHFVDALIASEDRSFFDHDGIDLSGVFRAAWSNLRGNDLQGASTITQQLVKNEFLSHDRTVSRKVREVVLATKLERNLTKEEILERYVNRVYFGRGAYGIEAAARVYFDKPAAELGLGEAAFLAGVLDAPEAADPLENPERARKERDLAIDAMVETGAIDQAAAEQAKATGVIARPVTTEPVLAEGVAAHFVEWVRGEVNELIGPDAATTAGLVIETTIDIDDQRAAEQAVAEVLTDEDDPQAALVAVDASGAIRAMVGSRSFDEIQVNLALGEDGGGGGRQAGSTFKPFVLAAAIDNGVAVKADRPAPATITVTVDGQPWTVSNYGDSAYGSLDAIEGTVRSSNTTYAQLMAEVGPAKVADMAARLGITSEIPELPSIALGTAEVSPLDMAGSFMTFARRGERVEPYAISRVLDGNGKVLFEADPESEQVLDEGTADVVNFALEQVVARGTATAAQIGRPAAGKTGTTQDFGDAWFVGYTPTYGAAVWMGYPEGQSRAMTDVRGRSVTGGSFPAEIWRRFMEIALEDVDVEDFAPPPGDLLEDPDKPATLSVDPAEGPPGAEVTVSGSGYANCAEWYVQAEGGEVRLGSQSGRDDDGRSVRAVIPVDAEPGSTITFVAYCGQAGSSAQPAARASFVVADDDEDPGEEVPPGQGEEPDGPGNPDKPDRDSTTTTSTSSTTTTSTTTTSTTTTTTQPPADD